MNLQTLLGEMPKKDFVENHFNRFPYTRAGTAAAVAGIAAWDRVAAILASPEADTLVVRDGARYAGPAPTSVDAVGTLIREGYTLLARHAERHCTEIATLAESFRRDFDAVVDVHVYVTPPGKHGFGWHYDAEDVFIVQTAGSKQYSLRKNTVHPWPVVESLPENMAYEREIMPLMRVTLAPGDWLYIPCGYWHKAESIGSDPAISFAIGVLSRSAIDIYDFVRQHVVQSLVWRQRLPLRGDASPWNSNDRHRFIRELFHQLGDDLSKMFHDERVIQSFLDAESPA